MNSLTPFEQGYQASSLASNPYWPNYPNDVPEDEKIAARVFVDGYTKKLKDQRATA